MYPEYSFVDEYEDDRIHGLDVARLRGKGAPKKKRTPEGMNILVPGLRCNAIRNTDVMSRCRIEEIRQEEEVDQLYELQFPQGSRINFIFHHRLTMAVCGDICIDVKKTDQSLAKCLESVRRVRCILRIPAKAWACTTICIGSIKFLALKYTFSLNSRCASTQHCRIQFA